MKMTFWDLDNDIIFDDEHINVIEIENKKYFKNIIEKINLYCNNILEENDIMLFDKDERMNIKNNVLILFDLFNININDKKIIAKLYNKISSDSDKEVELNNDFENIKLEIISYINKLIIEYPFEYTYKNNIKIEDIFKIINLKFDEEFYQTTEEKLYMYLDIISYFNICKILIIPNLKTYFEDEQLIEIYKYCKYKKINLMVIEQGISEKVLKYEKKLYIDDTFDEFVIKSIE